MKREERKRGLAHLLRGGAVVVMSLCLAFVTTTPSNAVTPTLDLPTVPKLYIPAHWTLAAEVAPQAVTGLGSEATGCFANRVCSLVLLGTAALAATSTAAILWNSQSQNTDVPTTSTAKPGLFVEYPTRTQSTNSDGVITYSTSWTASIMAGTSTAWPYNSATFYVADGTCTNGCYKIRSQSYNDDDPTSCLGSVGAGWNTHAQGFSTYSGDNTGSGTYIPKTRAINTTLTGTVGSHCYSSVRYQVLLKATDGTAFWSTYDQSLVAGAASLPEHGSVSTTFSTTSNPDRRLRTETRCTTPAGVSTTNVTTSNTYKHTDTSRPGFQASCPSGARSTAVTVLEERKSTTATDWVPSGTTVVLPPSPTPACQPGNAGALACRPGLLYELVFPDLIADPTWTYSDCVIGATACSAQILDLTNPTQPVDCGVTTCVGFQAAADGVEAGTTTWAQTPYVCQYGAYQLPASECAHTFPVSAVQSYTTDPQPSPSPSPSPTTTPPSTSGGGFECGFDLNCYAQSLFIPNPQTTAMRLQAIRDAFYNTPLGFVPIAITGIAAPFYLDTWEPDATNCAGPTLTLPRNMGVSGIDVGGNYVIQPLYACTDTPAGQFGNNISTTIRSILGPTVYISGVYIIVNTLLSAIGLALPAFYRDDTVDGDTGEITRGGWRTRSGRRPRVVRGGR